MNARITNQELYHHAKAVIPGGTGLFSKRPEMMAPELYPPYFRNAKGCRVTDLDGREYIDFTTMGIGACLLGYNDPEVSEAVVRTVRDGCFSSITILRARTVRWSGARRALRMRM